MFNTFAHRNCHFSNRVASFIILTMVQTARSFYSNVMTVHIDHDPQTKCNWDTALVPEIRALRNSPQCSGSLEFRCRFRQMRIIRFQFTNILSFAVSTQSADCKFVLWYVKAWSDFMESVNTGLYVKVNCT